MGCGKVPSHVVRRCHVVVPLTSHSLCCWFRGSTQPHRPRLLARKSPTLTCNALIHIVTEHLDCRLLLLQFFEIIAWTVARYTCTFGIQYTSHRQLTFSNISSLKLFVCLKKIFYKVATNIFLCQKMCTSVVSYVYNFPNICSKFLLFSAGYWLTFIMRISGVQ